MSAIPFLLAMGLQASPEPGAVPPGRYTRRLDGPQRRLTPEEAEEEERRLYGPQGRPDPSSRQSTGVPTDPIRRRRRVDSEPIEIPRRRLPKEGPPR